VKSLKISVIIAFILLLWSLGFNIYTLTKNSLKVRTIEANEIVIQRTSKNDGQLKVLDSDGNFRLHLGIILEEDWPSGKWTEVPMIMMTDGEKKLVWEAPPHLEQKRK